MRPVLAEIGRPRVDGRKLRVATPADIPLLLKPGEGKRGAAGHIVSDYGAGDPAFGEVRDRLHAVDSYQMIHSLGETSVPPFNTTATGIWVAQHALEGRAQNRFVYQNTAPRGTEGLEKITWGGQDEQPFAVGLTQDGVPIFGVHAGYNFSGVKDELAGLWKVNVPNDGAQFRSRDNYPDALRILQGETELVGEELPVNGIPDFPDSAVGFVDGYGNIKTTRRRGPFIETPGMAESPLVRVTVGDRRFLAHNKMVEGVEPGPGELFVAAGSTGGEGDKRFMEVNVMSGDAASVFNLNPTRIRDRMGVMFEPTHYR